MRMLHKIFWGVAYIAVGAGGGFAIGAVTMERTETHNRVINERKMLEQLASVQAYNSFVDGQYDKLKLPSSSLLNNPERLDQLEKVMLDPTVVRYAQLEQEPTSQFSIRKGFYVAPIGAALASLFLAWILSYTRSSQTSSSIPGKRL